MKWRGQFITLGCYFLINLRSSQRTILVGFPSLWALIESTKMVFAPSLLPARMSVNGLSPTITTCSGIIPIFDNNFLMALVEGLFAFPII